MIRSFKSQCATVLLFVSFQTAGATTSWTRVDVDVGPIEYTQSNCRQGEVLADADDISTSIGCAKLSVTINGEVLPVQVTESRDRGNNDCGRNEVLKGIRNALLSTTADCSRLHVLIDGRTTPVFVEPLELRPSGCHRHEVVTGYVDEIANGLASCSRVYVMVQVSE